MLVEVNMDYPHFTVMIVVITATAALIALAIQRDRRLSALADQAILLAATAKELADRAMMLASFATESVASSRASRMADSLRRNSETGRPSLH